MAKKWPDPWPNEIVGMAMAMVAIPDFTSMAPHQTHVWALSHQTCSFLIGNRLFVLSRAYRFVIYVKICLESWSNLISSLSNIIYTDSDDLGG